MKVSHSTALRHAKERRPVCRHFWKYFIWRDQRLTEGRTDGMEAGAERASGAVRPGHHHDCARPQNAPTASTASAAAARALCRPVRRRSPQDGRCAGPQRRAPCARPQQLAEWLLLLFAAYGGSSNGCLLAALRFLCQLPAICCAEHVSIVVNGVSRRS